MERLSIHPINSPATSEFTNMMISSGLLDIGFSSSRFTWSNNRQGRSYVAVMLDRSLTNHAWSLSFPDALVQHLVRQNSNHSPILLSSRPTIAARYIPFKFEEMWISHPSFKDLVASVWSIPVEGNPEFILNQKLKSLKTRLKTWIKEVFGNLKTNISTTENNILLLQESMDSVPLDPTKSALGLARCTLQNLLQAEETHWKQKSRANWLQEGDRNTNFFTLPQKSEAPREGLIRWNSKASPLIVTLRSKLLQ
ncbi:hypothetical protein AAC387_Pa10g0964 [Persea americana]